MKSLLFLKIFLDAEMVEQVHFFSWLRFTNFDIKKQALNVLKGLKEEVGDDFTVRQVTLAENLLDPSRRKAIPRNMSSASFINDSGSETESTLKKYLRLFFCCDVFFSTSILSWQEIPVQMVQWHLLGSEHAPDKRLAASFQGDEV